METEFKLSRTIGGTTTSVTIKRPTTFKKELFPISDITRLANGSSTGRRLANKIKLYFTYDVISSMELEPIIEMLWEKNGIPVPMFVSVTYMDNNVMRGPYTMYAGSMPMTLQRSGGKTQRGLWIWKDFTFNLIQQ